jgi:hypothetical protein
MELYRLVLKTSVLHHQYPNHNHQSPRNRLSSYKSDNNHHPTPNLPRHHPPNTFHLFHFTYLFSFCTRSNLMAGMELRCSLLLLNTLLRVSFLTAFSFRMRCWWLWVFGFGEGCLVLEGREMLEQLVRGGI